jgi:inner membrane transporter RhtA
MDDRLGEERAKTLKFVEEGRRSPSFAEDWASSVIPYVCDQHAMARLPRATFALMLTMLPATATIVGALVLGQWPSPIEIVGIVAVAIGTGVHKPASD